MKISEQEAFDIASGNGKYKLIKAESTGYTISNYYSRYAEGRKFFCEVENSVYSFILYGRPAEREGNSSFGGIAFYNNEIELKLEK